MQDKMGGACSIVINLEDERLLGKPERRFGCNIKMDCNPYPANIENMVSS